MGNLSDMQDSSSFDMDDSSSDSRGDEHVIDVDAGDDDSSLASDSFGVNAKSAVDEDSNTQSLLQVG